MNHIFWDNSNIFIGAQTVCSFTEGNRSKIALRINFENLLLCVINGRDFNQKVLAGSVPPQCDSVWSCARSHGFETNLLQRIEDEYGKQHEQAVDEILHLKIVNAAAQNLNDGGNIVILSGDGRTSNFGTSFTGQAEIAINLGWKIENWCWGMTRSKEWDNLAIRHPDKVSLHVLDPYYESVTYLEGGEYYQKAGLERHYYNIENRQSKSLMH